MQKRDDRVGVGFRPGVPDTRNGTPNEMKGAKRMPQLPSLGPREDVCRYVFLDCGGERRWTEPLRTPSVPLQTRKPNKVKTCSPCPGVYRHTHTHVYVYIYIYI